MSLVCVIIEDLISEDVCQNYDTSTIGIHDVVVLWRIMHSLYHAQGMHDR